MPAASSSARAAAMPASSDSSRARRSAAAQRPRERDGALAVAGAQVGVSRAHRQPVRLAHGRQPLDPHRDVEVAHHAPDHRQLLGVLLAEVGDVGLTVLKSLATTVVTPRKWLGPAPRGVAVEDLGQALDLDRGREAVGVDLLDRGRVDEVDAGLGGEPRVALLVARVALEVLAGAELGRVDEEAHDDHVALLAGGAQQREVPVVQEAHRRHQADRAALGAGRRQRRAQLVLARGRRSRRRLRAGG